MKEISNTPPATVDSPRRKKLRRLAFLVAISVVVAHILAGLGAGAFVVARYFTKPAVQFTNENRVEMKPEERQHRLAMDEVASMSSTPVLNNRIQSLKPSKLVLPELPKVPVDIPMPVVDAAPIASIGQPNGQGSQSGAGGGSGFFGGSGTLGSGLLEGMLYDLKQTSDGKSTPFTVGKDAMGAADKRWVPYIKVVQRFVTNWNDSTLDRYFHAPRKLYISQFALPPMPATLGPKEFGVDDKVRPCYWLAHYKGRVIAPKDGSFRFIGYGDNVMIVRFGGRNVLDGSWVPMYDNNRSKFYKYAKLAQDDKHYAEGGHVVGNTITVKKGQAYDMEVLIGEQDGGLTGFSLMIEDLDGKYEKDPDGYPILPLFKQKESDTGNLANVKGFPPISQDAPIWAPAPVASKPNALNSVSGL